VKCGLNRVVVLRIEMPDNQWCVDAER